MKLDQFISESGLSRADFAKAIGVSEVSVTRYIGGSRIPRPVVLAKISEVTKGSVTPNDFLLASGVAPASQPEPAQ
jgi:transcriptional regulator with XRE-family HTH domain